ncbi:MAG: hypothetical protein ACK2UL_06315 [Anaerolineae bacterium]
MIAPHIAPGQRPLAVVLVAAVTSALTSAAAAPTSKSDRSASVPSVRVAVGLAHVDLMDLHVERLPGGGTTKREVLEPGEVDERYDKAVAAGAAWNRWSLYWDMVDASGGYDWSVADDIVERDRDAGLRTLAILQGTPARYSTSGSPDVVPPRVGGGTPGRIHGLTDVDGAVPVAIQAAVPKGLDEPAFLDAGGVGTDDPELADHYNPANPWAAFVAEAVGRYRPGGALALSRGWGDSDGIRAWEVGNEPNLRQFWDGSAAEFARYLEVAYVVVRWADSAATVVHGGIADDAGADAWYGQLLDELTAKAERSPLPARYGYYFDATAWHWYSYPALLGSGPARARQLLRDHGLPDKPVWVTEMGVPIWSEHPGPCWDPASPWRATAVEQAGYVWQALTEAAYSGVEVAVLFQAYDDCGNGPASYDAFGFVRNHASNQCWEPPGQTCWRLEPALAGVPRPAHAVLAAAADHLGESEPLWRSWPVGDVERVLFYKAPDERVTVAWNWSRADRDLEVAATGAEGTLLTLDGSGVLTETSVRPIDGVHRLSLPAQTNSNNPGGGGLMAGRPVVLVERDQYGPFRAEIGSLPPASAPSFDLTVSAADGGTGVAAVRVLVAESPPAGPDGWRVWRDHVGWTAAPVSGQMAVGFAGEAGHTYYFAAQALDRAGNWSAVPQSAQASTRIAVGATVTTPATPGTATAYASPALTAPPTVSATATARRATATPGPSPVLDKSVRLPAALRRSDLCRMVRADVRGPRGDAITDPRGEWTLRALANDEVVGRSTQALGSASCSDPGAQRIEGWAVVPGYVSNAPQDLALSRQLYLAVAPNTLVNGGFEAGLAGWAVFGGAPPTASNDALAGSGAARLGSRASDGGARGVVTSALSQPFRVPAREATVSLRYSMVSARQCGADGCRDVDRAGLRLAPVEDPTLAIAELTGPEGLAATGSAWEHAHYGLEAWSGETVALVLELTQEDGAGGGWLLADELFVGPAHPIGLEGSRQ